MTHPDPALTDLWPMTPRRQWSFLAADEADTTQVATALAESLRRLPEPRPGLSIWLSGTLGAGKTTLVRAVLRALGYAGRVKSPTYTLVEAYELLNLYFYHFDFYRFSEPREFLEGGFDEYFGAGALCWVEWPEKALPALPPPDLILRLSVPDAGVDPGPDASTARLLHGAAFSSTGETCLSALQSLLADPSSAT